MNVSWTRGNQAQPGQCSSFGVPYGSRTRVAAVKEKPPIVIQWKLAAWIALYALQRLTGIVIGLLMDSRLPSGFSICGTTDFDALSGSRPSSESTRPVLLPRGFRSNQGQAYVARKRGQCFSPPSNLRQTCDKTPLKQVASGKNRWRRVVWHPVDDCNWSVVNWLISKRDRG